MPNPPSQFATLADIFRRCLADPRKIYYPTDIFRGGDDAVLRPVGDFMRDLKIPKAMVLHDQLFGDCKRMLRQLDGAHRIVLEPDFTEMASDLGEQDPITIARLMTTARLPFPSIWIEWPEQHRSPRMMKDAPIRTGMLITPDASIDIPGGGYTATTVIQAAVTGTDGMALDGHLSCAPSPVGFVFNFEHPVVDEHGTVIGWEPTRLMQDREVETTVSLGGNYLRSIQKDHPDQLGLAMRLCRHSASVVADPFGQIHRGIMNYCLKKSEAGDADIERFTEIAEKNAEFMETCTRALHGNFRWLTAIFALMATHLGGDPVVASRKQKGRGSFIRGKFLPAYEYRVVTLVRPMPTPTFIKRLPAGTGLGRREHEVEGSWHHQRADSPSCHVHPRACPMAVWVKIKDDEGNPVGSDQQVCHLCKRRRWRVEAHLRGDRALGVIEKGYKITAKGSDHSFITQRTQPLEPGQKTLPVALADLRRRQQERKTDGRSEKST